MVFVGTMRNEELEPFTFTSLAVAAARVVDRLNSDEQQHEDRRDNASRHGGREERTADRIEYARRRLHEIQTWERRISGRE